MPRRQIIHIDEELCDGCGLCVDACHEGAIQIVDGKARLVSEILCDGFGDCLGDCPQGAITIETREAAPFSEAAVAAHLRVPSGGAIGAGTGQAAKDEAAAATPGREAQVAPAPGLGSALPTLSTCPGSAARDLRSHASPDPGDGSPRSPADPGADASSGAGPATGRSTTPPAATSSLSNWPVQLHLVPVQAPYFQEARLLIAADCVPFALPGFHKDLLGGRILVVGCPKLDDTSAYLEKLTAIFRFNDIRSVEIAIMEVPCCRGLVMLVQKALQAAGKADTLSPSLVRVGIRGELERLDPPARQAAAPA